MGDYIGPDRVKGFFSFVFSPLFVSLPLPPSLVFFERSIVFFCNKVDLRGQLICTYYSDSLAAAAASNRNFLGPWA